MEISLPDLSANQLRDFLVEATPYLGRIRYAVLKIVIYSSTLYDFDSFYSGKDPKN